MLRAIILIVAIGAGSLAGWIALSMNSGAAAPPVQAPPPPQIAMVDVLVASNNLSQGQALTEAGLRWQPWPKNAAGAGFITRAAQPEAMKTLAGSMVRNPFVSGEPIREDKLSRNANLLASLLPSGKRAVAIRISVESTAGGFILPNDRVDVIQTVTRMGEGQTDNLSRTLLTNIRVLALDQTMTETKGHSSPGAKTATLELNTAQAEAIAAGQISGTLSLALRSASDNEEEPVLNRRNSASVRVMRAGKTELVKF